MGLMYVFPVDKDESDFIQNHEGTLTLKTYGLPYVFWIYAICSVMMVFFMFFAIKEPVLKLMTLGDETDALLGYSLLGFIGLLPVFIFSFFFYEKRITRNKNTLGLEHRVYGIKVFSEKFLLENNDQLIIDSFLSSPNVARMRAQESTQGFQNKGYFVLWLKSADGKKIMIDRHSRKADLEKLKTLIENY